MIKAMLGLFHLPSGIFLLERCACLHVTDNHNTVLIMFTTYLWQCSTAEEHSLTLYAPSSSNSFQIHKTFAISVII